MNIYCIILIIVLLFYTLEYMDNYKYIKYKFKYINHKNQYGGVTPGQLRSEWKLDAVVSIILDATTDRSVDIAKNRLEFLLQIARNKNSDDKIIKNFDTRLDDIKSQIVTILTSKSNEQKILRFNQLNSSELDCKLNEINIETYNIAYERAKIELNKINKTIAIITLKHYELEEPVNTEYIDNINESITEYTANIDIYTTNIKTSETAIAKFNSELTVLNNC